MFKRSRAVWVAIIAVLLGSTLLQISSSLASVHLIHIKKIFPGTQDQPNAQFIELQMYASGQNFTANHEISVFNATGTKTGSFKFLANVANGADLSSILAATSEAQSAFGITADLTMTPVLEKAGGKVCFSGSGDCASWGSFSGPGSGIGATGTPFNASEGLVPGALMDRRIGGGTSPTRLDGGDDINDSASDFELTSPPMPRNNVGTSGSHCCTTGFSASQYSVAENGGAITVTVTRSPSAGGISVSYQTSDGTALAGLDYTSASGSLSFADGESTKTFDVAISTDSEEEYDETVNLKLRALSSGAYSRVSSTIKIVGDRPTTVPSAPTNPLAVAGPGMGQISLSWSPPTTDGGLTVTNYKLYRGSNPSLMILLKIVTGNVFQYVDGGIQPGRTLHYKFTAVNSLGEGPASAIVSATTFPDKPAAPTNLQALPGGAGKTNLSWTAPINNGSQILGYQIYRGRSSGTEVFLEFKAGTGTTYVDQTCPLGAICYYMVSAVNSVGEGPRSNEAFMLGTSS